MPLQIIRQDITLIKCDAVVNPTDRWLSGGGGADAAIHDAAGKNLDLHCEEIGSLSVGEAIITPAYDMPYCKHIIHVVGPVWQGGLDGERVLLRSCYLEALKLAWENKCRCVAFPLIASGTYGYPKDKVLKLATATISEFLMKHEMNVYLVVYDKESYEISKPIDVELKRWFEVVNQDDDEFDCADEEERYYRDDDIYYCDDSIYEDDDDWEEEISSNAKLTYASSPAPKNISNTSLSELLKNMDKGFSETLFHYIDQKDMSDVEAYKRSNVSRKLFSKIKCNKNYKPSKITAVSFAIGLRLDIDETEHLLNTAGISLSRADVFDVIIGYFIVTGNYESIHDVNEVLYKYDQSLLGC